MNRDILFRGKRTDNGEWVAGHYSTLYTKSGGELLLTHYIMYQIAGRGMVNIRVDKDSVGQFTGLTDKNGTKIFEGDVMKMRNVGWEYTIVGYANGAFSFFTTESNYLTPMTPCYWEEGEVIGNRFDNPELMQS